MKTLSDKELVEIVDRAMKKFKGNMSRFSNAVGYLFIARKFGWRVALLMHDRKSVKDYEKILGINPSWNTSPWLSSADVVRVLLSETVSQLSPLAQTR